MTATTRALELASTAAEAATDKLARDIVAFDVSERLAITDVFVICSAPSDRQVGAIVDAVEEKLLEHGAKPVRREGERSNRWVLLDYLDIVVHVQHAEEREFYALERLWRDCPQVPVPGAETSEDGTPDATGPVGEFAVEGTVEAGAPEAANLGADTDPPSVDVDGSPDEESR